VPTATIIGAGPAGSMAAMLLARRGWLVTLVEQHRFPRDKVCGECLSALGIEVLERHGLADVVRTLDPVTLRWTTLVSPDGDEATIELPSPMWGISRLALDTLLVGQAVDAGARLLQPARVESLDPASHDCVGRDLASNQTFTLRSDYVLVADGKGALGVTKPPSKGDLGVKAHFADVEDFPDRITLLGVHGHYVGLAPIEGGRWNLCMSVPATRIAECRGDFDAFLTQLRAENRGLDRRFAHAARVGQWLASPLPRFPVAAHWPDGVIPLGNVAAALEPIGGEGMGLAMRSAEGAATTLCNGGDAEKLRRSFHRLWRRRRASCRAAAIGMSHPNVAAAAVRTIAAHESVASASMTLIGK
jgi:flavin-dependent dehydrogenase